MDNQNTTPPDMIAQAGELLKRIQNGHRIGVDWSDDKTIVIASAILAVAAELRDIRNVLAMAMSEGADMNGAPISSLRIDTGA